MIKVKILILKGMIKRNEENIKPLIEYKNKCKFVILKARNTICTIVAIAIPALILYNTFLPI